MKFSLLSGNCEDVARSLSSLEHGKSNNGPVIGRKKLRESKRVEEFQKMQTEANEVPPISQEPISVSTYYTFDRRKRSLEMHRREALGAF